MAENSDNRGFEEQKTNNTKMAKVNGNKGDVETAIKEGSREKEELTETLQEDLESFVDTIFTNGAAAAPTSGPYEPDMKSEVDDLDDEYNTDSENNALAYGEERQGVREPERGVSNIEQDSNGQPLLHDKSHSPHEFPSRELAEGAEACLPGKVGDQRENITELRKTPTPAELSTIDSKFWTHELNSKGTGSSVKHASFRDTEERFPAEMTVAFVTEQQCIEREHLHISDQKQLNRSHDQRETQNAFENKKQASDDSERADGSESTDDDTTETPASTGTLSYTPISGEVGSESTDDDTTETPASTGTPSYTRISGEVPPGALSNAPECTYSPSVQSVPPRPSFPCPGLGPRVLLRFSVVEITDSVESRQLGHDMNMGAPGLADDRQQARAEAAGYYRGESPEDGYATDLQTGDADLTDDRDLPEQAQGAEAMEPQEFNAAADFQIYDDNLDVESEADEQIRRISLELQRNPSLSGQQLLRIILDVLGLMPHGSRCQKTGCERESQVLLYPHRHRVCEPCYLDSYPFCPVCGCRVTQFTR